jgi:hypothetical protein
LVLSFMLELIFLLALVMIGAIVIILVRALVFFLPAIVLAFVVWGLTGSLTFAGLAFFIIAIISVLKRR